ncbi:MAG: HemK2/MTQ2 family protein methyltransferase [Candidatus Nanohaloarchaea archaeon]
MTYQPREDSLFLKEWLEEQDLEGKRLLDMGTGSGILAVTSAKKGAEVTAVDVDPEALDDARDHVRQQEVHERITFVESDQFEQVTGRFDIVVFNPPYLQGEEHLALEGGKGGVELTERFLEEVDDHLRDNGQAVFIASSRSDVEKLRQGFELELLDDRKMWFETLYLFKSE